MAVSHVFHFVCAQLIGCSLARNLILAHARAVKVYRSEFKPQQKGVIGITLVSGFRGRWAEYQNIEWVKGWDESEPAQAAAQRSLSIMAGLYADPICTTPAPYPGNS